MEARSAPTPPSNKADLYLYLSHGEGCGGRMPPQVYNKAYSHRSLWEKGVSTESYKNQVELLSLHKKGGVGAECLHY